MRFNLLSPVVVAIGFLLVQLSFTSCSFGGGGGGGCLDAGWDLSGEWHIVAEVTSASGSGCVVDPGNIFESDVILIQNGTDLVVLSKDAGYEGTVCGDMISFSGEDCDGDICGEEQWSLTLSSNNEATGTAHVFATNGSLHCTADFDVHATRTSPLITDEENNTAIVVNKRHDCGILVVMRPQGQGVGNLMPIGYVQPGGVVVFPLPSALQPVLHQHKK